MVDCCTCRWVLSSGCITPTAQYTHARLQPWLKCLYSPLCSALTHPPALCSLGLPSNFSLLIHLSGCISFVCRCFSKSGECCAKAVLVQCWQAREDGKSSLAYKDEGEVQMSSYIRHFQKYSQRQGQRDQKS